MLDSTETGCKGAGRAQTVQRQVILRDRFSVAELKEFKENQRGSPEYVVNMCFGEKFPDGKPLEKKLIVVKVNKTYICIYMCVRPYPESPTDSLEMLKR